MTRSKRMQPVVKVAASKEQDAARQLGECQREVDARQARLAELLAYQAEYAQRFEASGGDGLDMARMQDYRVFLARLNDAITQQRRLVQVALNDYAKKKNHWLSTRQQAQAIDKVVDRFKRDEVRAEGRRDQAETDERALQTHARRNPESGDR
jgi:flagellar FliJ protein